MHTEETFHAKWLARLAPLTGFKGMVVGAEEDDDFDDDGDGDTGENPEAEIRRLKSEIRSLRDENAKRRTQQRESNNRIKELEKQVASGEGSEKVVADLTAKLEAANKQISTLKVEKDVVSAASDFNDPSDVMRLLDSSEYMDEDGIVDSAKLKRALRALAKNKPYLLRSDSGNDAGDDDGDGEDGDDGDNSNGETANNQSGNSRRNYGSNNAGSGKGNPRTKKAQSEFDSRVAEYGKGYTEQGTYVPMPDLGGHPGV